MALPIIPTSQSQIQQFAASLYGVAVGSQLMAQIVNDVQALNGVNPVFNNYYSFSFGSTPLPTVAARIADNVGLTGEARTQAIAFLGGALAGTPPSERGAAVNTIMNQFLTLGSDPLFGSFVTAWTAKLAAVVAYTGPDTVALSAVTGAQTFVLTSSAPVITEGDVGTKVLTYTLTLDKAPADSVVVNYQSLTTGTAAPGDDFAPVAGSVTFEAGQTARTVSVVVNSDTIFEANETVLVQFSGAKLAASVTATGTINDNDVNPATQVFTLTSSAPTVTEGNAGTKVLTYTLTLSGAPAQAVAVNYETLATGSASAGDDFAASAGTVTFAAGQTAATVTITVNGDVGFEVDETVAVRFTGANLAAPVTATGTILNDDADPATVPDDLTPGFDLARASAALVRGIVDGGSIAGSTYTPGDNITLTDANNTVLRLFVVDSGTAALATVSNVDSIEIVGQTTGTIDFDGRNWTNVGNVSLVDGTGLEVDLAKLASGVDLYIATDGAGTLDATYKNGLRVRLENDDVGGASYVDGDITLNVADSASASANVTSGEVGVTGSVVVGDVVGTGGDADYLYFSADVDNSVDLTIGDVSLAITGDGTASVSIDADNGDLVVGDVSVVAGDAGSALAYVYGGAGMTVGDVSVSVGDSGLASVSMTNDADYTVGDISAQAGDSATAYVYLSNTGDITVGDVSLVAGDGAVATFSMEVSGDVSVGDVAISVGDSSTGYMYYGIYTGDVSYGDVTISGGAAALASASVSATGDISFGDVALSVGDSGTANLYVYATSGDATLGDVSLSAGDSASVSASVTGSDISIGNASLVVGNSANAYLYAYASADAALGDVSLSGGSSANASVSVTGENIDIGDVSMSVGDSGRVSLWNYATSSLVVGDVSVNVGDNGDLYMSLTGSDVVVGDVTLVHGDQTAGNGWTDEVFIYGTGGGSVSVGDIDLTAGDVLAATGTSDSARLTIDLDITNLSGTDLSVGDVSISLGETGQTASATQTVTATLAAYVNITNTEAIGDLIVGNVDIDAGDGVTVSIDVRQDGVMYGAGGSLTVGDVSASMGQEGYLDIEIRNLNQASGTTSTTQVASSVGDLTVGDIAAVVGLSSDVSIDIGLSLTGTSGGDAGNLTVGTITLSATDNVSLDVSITALNNAGGDVGNVTVGSMSLVAEDEADVDVTVDVSASAGDVGNVTVGSINLVAGELGDATATIDISAGGDVGNVTVGNVTMAVGDSGDVGTFSLDINAAGDLGNVTVGNITLSAGDSGDISYSISVDADNVGQVTIGDVTLTLGDDGSATELSVDIFATDTIAGFSMGNITVTGGDDVSVSDIDIELSADVIGDISIGNITVTVGDGASADITSFDIEIDATSVGDVSIGNITLTAGDDGSIDDFSLDISATTIDSITIGNVSLTVGESGDVDSQTIDINAGSVGDITIGDLSMVLGVNASDSSGFSITIDASTGDIGNVTIGTITVVAGSNAYDDTDAIDIAAALGDIGNVSIGGLVMTYDESATGGGLSVTIDATNGSIGNFSFGDLVVNLADNASVSDLLYVSIDADGIGDITFGDHLVTLADASRTSYDSVTIDIAGDIGEVTFGDIIYTLGDGGYTESGVYRGIYADGDIGDVAFGDVKMIAGSGASFTSSWDITVSATGNIGNVTFGNLVLDGSNVGTTMEMYLELTADDIGTITLGDVLVSNVNDANSASNLYASLTVDIDATDLVGGLEIGDVTLIADGNVSVTVSGSTSTTYTYDGDAYFYVFVSGNDLGDVQIGDISISAKDDGDYAEMQLFTTITDDIGDVIVGDISMLASHANATAFLNLELDEGGLGGIATVGNVSFEAVDTGRVQVAIDAGAADVTIESITIKGDGTAAFGAEYALTVTGDVVHVSNIVVDITAANAGLVNLANVVAGLNGTTETLGTVDFSGYKRTAATTVGETINVSAFDGDITVIGTGRNDTITDNDEENSLTGGAGADTFVFELHDQSIDDLIEAAAADVDVVEDLVADVDSITLNTTGNVYIEDTASSFNEFITKALNQIANNNADLVAVQVGLDTWLAVNEDGGSNIDHIIQLVGVNRGDIESNDFTFV